MQRKSIVYKTNDHAECV